MQKITAKHQPVLLSETIDLLKVEPGKWYVDATFGRGGHTREMLKLGANVIALDVDHEAIEYGKNEFEKYIQDDHLILIRTNFEEINTQVKKTNKLIFGILFDFGTSFDQLTHPDRGFSFQHESPLDMRMDDRLGVTAADLLAVLPEKQLEETFRKYGGEVQARGIARKIVQKRAEAPIKTTTDLIKIIEPIKRSLGHKKIHPATKVFQALRIIVNSELIAIEQGLNQALELIEPKGRIATIAFHEGEDRIAKHKFRDWENSQLVKVLTSKPFVPTQEETEVNPAARSAKLRAVEKL